MQSKVKRTILAWAVLGLVWALDSAFSPAVPEASYAIAPLAIGAIMGGAAGLGQLGQLIGGNKARKQEQAARDNDYANRVRRAEMFKSLLKAHGLDKNFGEDAFTVHRGPRATSDGPGWFDILSSVLTSGAGGFLGAKTGGFGFGGGRGAAPDLRTKYPYGSDPFGG